MAEGRVKDRANEPAGIESDKCPFGTRTPPRLGPSQLLQARSKFWPCRRPRKSYSGLARRRCRKFRLGLPIIRDSRSSKGGEVGTSRTVATQNHYTIGRRPSDRCYTSLCSAFCSLTKLDQLASEWGEGYFLAQAVFSAETLCLAFTVDRQ
jgi:hypothetical protein